MKLQLPAHKLQRVKELVQEWLGKDSGRQKDLESLVGLLQHASTVVRPGQHFIQGIIKEMVKVKRWNRQVWHNRAI